MSMLSAQCDELRQMAESVGLAMPQAATLMMEAADAIERLREQAEDMDFQLDKWQTKAEYFKQLADLAEADNAKLRTFIGLKETCWKYVGWCDECPYNGVDDEHDDCNCTVREKVNSLARELGVEVDG